MIEAPTISALEVEVKNIKVARNLSEETLAFTATLWIDGRKVGEVRNQGCGGSHFYDVPREDHERLEAEARRRGHTFEPVDALVDEQVEESELKRDADALRRKGAEVVVLVQRGRYEYPAHDGGAPVTGYADQILVGARAGADPAALAEAESAEDWKVVA